MLGAAQADALGAQLAGTGGVCSVVGVGANTHGAHLVGPFDDALEVLVDLRRNQLQRLVEDLTGGAVQSEDVALFVDLIVDGQGLGFGIDLDGGGAGNARLTEAASDDGRVARHAAVGGQHALRLEDAMDVVRRGFVSNQNDVLALFAELCGGVGVEDQAANCSARRCRQALGDGLGGVGRVDGRV